MIQILTHEGSDYAAVTQELETRVNAVLKDGATLHGSPSVTMIQNRQGTPYWYMAQLVTAPAAAAPAKKS